MYSIHDPRYQRAIRRLSDARHDCGLTQAQVAHHLGWRRTMLSNIETLERRADLLEVYELARVYGLWLADLGLLLEANDAPP